MRKPSTTALRRRGELPGEQLTMGLDLVIVRASNRSACAGCTPDWGKLA